MTVQCCKCKKIRENGEWIHRPHGLGHNVSHGYCPGCFDESFGEMLSEMGSPLAGKFSSAELV